MESERRDGERGKETIITIRVESVMDNPALDCALGYQVYDDRESLSSSMHQ